MSDSHMAPINCEWCGDKIPDSRRGNGHPPKTCSEPCRKARASDREKKRYQKVKNTSAWKETRNTYLDKLSELRKKDPELAAAIRAYSATIQRKYYDKLKKESPEKYTAITQGKRDERARWREQLISDPVAFEVHKAKARSWYKSLSEADRDRIFYKK